MTKLQTPIKSALASAALLALAACGGGGGGGGGAGPVGDGTSPPPDTRPQTKVIDGPVGHALVFADKNNNGVPDPDEPSARTDASGIARWEVSAADLAGSPLVAQVGTDAVDADHGPVGRAYRLAAPAGSTAVVSPLTTLVQRVVDQTGASAAQVEAALLSRTGITSLLADYTGDASAAGREAALAARMVVLHLQQQGERLAAQVGSPDAGGTPITAADVDQAAIDSIVRGFPALAQAARDGTLQSTCSSLGAAECASAVQAQVARQMEDSGLSPATLPVQAAYWRTPDSTATGKPGMSLSEFAYGDADNWYWRMLMTSNEDATPDAQNHTRFRQLRRQSTKGSVVEWGHGPTYARRDDTHWNGSAWQTCPETTVMSQTARDARGITAATDYCNGLQISTNRRWTTDIAGKDMLDVAVAMRAALPASMGNWAAPPANFTGTSTPALGGVSFPAEAKLYAQTGLNERAAPAYIPTSVARAYSAAVAAGGDARGNPGHACLSAETQANPTTEVTSLEMLMDRMKGQPCLYAQGVINSTTSPSPLPSPDPNQWWGNSTVNVGVIGNAPLLANPTTYFTSNTYINVAFDRANGTATFLSCLQRQVNGSTRTCTAVGSGAYRIETLGDARVLRLPPPPAIAAWLDYERLFVERGGKVYIGYQSKPAFTAVFRLNAEAANAMFVQLGLPTVTP